MKKYILTFVVIYISLVNGVGQTKDDLYITGSCLTDDVYVNARDTLEVFFVSQGTRVVQPGYIAITISFPREFFDLDIVWGDLTNYFDMHKSNDSTWYGLNIMPIPDDWGAGMYFGIVGISPTVPQDILIEVNFEPGPYSEFSDGDNRSVPNLQVLQPLPITISSFYASSKECGRIDLTWKTESEINNDYIEIERSIDGRRFETVGKVSGSNQRNGSVYSFTDDASELISGVKYYYRLRQVDFDGKSQVHKVIAVDYRCAGLPPTLSVYPNPAVDKVNFLLTGMDPDATFKGIIINNEGAEVKRIDLKAGTPYDMHLNDLPEGVYNIRVLDQNENLNKNFIKIR